VYLFWLVSPFLKKTANLQASLSENIFFRKERLYTATYHYEGWNFNSGNYLFTTDTK